MKELWAMHRACNSCHLVPQVCEVSAISSMKCQSCSQHQSFFVFLLKGIQTKINPKSRQERVIGLIHWCTSQRGLSLSHCVNFNKSFQQSLKYQCWKEFKQTDIIKKSHERVPHMKFHHCKKYQNFSSLVLRNYSTCRSGNFALPVTNFKKAIRLN